MGTPQKSGDTQYFPVALEATVIERITPSSGGCIKCQGIYYKAELLSAKDVVTLPVGAKVLMVALRANIALIRSVGVSPPTIKQAPQSNSSELVLSIDSPVNASADEVALEIANLCRALNAYQIACGGNGLTIDEWETLVRNNVPARG